MYNCLLKRMEDRSGCKVNQSLQNPGNFTPCSDITPLAKEALAGFSWQEIDLPQAGCVPSCTRETFTVKEVVESTMSNAAFISTVPEHKRYVLFNSGKFP